MAKYVDLDEVNKRIIAETIENDPTNTRFIWAVLDVPAADVAPVRRGEWKRDREGRPVCSECAEEPYRNGDYNLPNYCPNCGAKMEG